MHYISTRGNTPPMPFCDAVVTGLAPDGGLLLPETVPDVRAQLDALAELDYVGLAKAVIGLFVADIARAELDRIIDRAYAVFDCDDVVRLVDLDDVHVLELFHGPTLAFKDVALQFLGGVFEYVLGARDEHLNILAATSGDTGSAAIAGVRGQPHIDIFVMYPNGRVSPLQERQMTTVPDDNVHCIAIDGSFDDCQQLMKTLFADLSVKSALKLGAVNSVNWARVLAQIVYYAYAALRLSNNGAMVNFSVPTGNFGNIFAGYLARRMGFPVGTLVLATNENDILSTFFNSGDYQRGDVHFTITPAMDIQVASNFERFLFYEMDADAQRLCAFMSDFAATGRASLGHPPRHATMLATSVDARQTEATIRELFNSRDYVVDPHTAVGIAGARRLKHNMDGPVVCLATAHPAKFPESVDAIVGAGRASHPALDALSGLTERRTDMANDVDALKKFLERHTGR